MSISLIISVLISLGSIASPSDYHDAAPAEKQQMEIIVIDEIGGM